MSCYIDVIDVNKDIIYGLLIGSPWRDIGSPDRKILRRWCIHLYTSDKGRKQGMRWQKRIYHHSDFLTFEIKVRDLFNGAKLATIIPRELPVDDDVRHFLNAQQKRGF